MASLLTILLPIFGLILAGFVCRRSGVFSAYAASELNRYVVWLALPALLFDIVSHSHWRQLWQPGVIATFAVATTTVFTVTLLLRLRHGRPLADATVDAMAASYSNTGYVGFPLCLLAFGPVSQTPATIGTIFVVCVLFAIALVLIEIGQHEVGAHERLRLGRLLLKLGSSLARNPLIVVPALGVVVATLQWQLPTGIDTVFKLLGSSASPCALVSLGLFLANKPPAAASQRVPWALAATKLVLLPGFAWWLAHKVFDLPPTLADIVVLLAALPTGTGPYMLAEYYQRDAGVTSRTILFSTVLSLVTLSVLLQLQKHG